MFKVNTKSATEMAMTRQDVIERCISLGKNFIEHFHKVYTMKSQNFVHHCREMQSWLDSINSIKFKSNLKSLSKTEKMDWFFTVGSTPDYFLKDDEEVSAYENFVVSLLANSELTVAEALKDYNI